MKKILKKLLICICLFLTLFNFTMIESNYVYAATFTDNMKAIFDDPDEDEKDVLPIFKGRNIFGS